MDMVEKKVNCEGCGQEIAQYLYSLCLDCPPYMYKKQKHPHQIVRRTKSWEENRQKRINESNHQCQICSKNEDALVIHHLEGITSRTYEAIWNGVIEEKRIDLVENDVNWKNKWDDLISDESKKKLAQKIQSDYFKKKGIKKMNTCPYCGRASISERKTKKPRYRCGKCSKEFEQPKFQIPSHYYLSASQLERHVEKIIKTTIQNEIIKNHFQVLKKAYQVEVNSIIERYLSMENTVVLCARCHYATEKGEILCPSCKEHYIFPGYNICMHCQNADFLEENGALYIIDELEMKENHDRDDFKDDFDFDNVDFDDDFKLNKKYQIKSIYDKNLVAIYRDSGNGKWYPKQKVWKFREFSFQYIIKKVLEYLSSTEQPYKLTYIDKYLLDVKIGLEKSSNYRESLVREIPKCTDEMDGYCNHAGGYIYGDTTRCTQLECSDYFSPDTPPIKIIEIITKLHIIDNYDHFQNK